MTTASPVLPVGTQKWTEQNGIIRFSVTSNGMTGEQWITFFETQGRWLCDRVKSMLRSSEFRPTNGVTTEVAIIRGRLVKNKKRIRTFAAKRNLIAPNAEVACIMASLVHDELSIGRPIWWLGELVVNGMDLGAIVTMHAPITDCMNEPSLFIHYGLDKERLLEACYKELDDEDNDYGFAFVASKKAD